MTTQSSNPPSGEAPYGTPPGGPASPSTPPGAEFFDRIRGLGVVRPDQGRWAAGVCAGLAHRWGLDPLLVRGLFVVVSLVGGFGLALYGLLWLFLPHQDGRIHAQEVLQGTVTAGFIGAALSVLGSLPANGAFHGWGNGPWGFYPFGGGFAVLALIGAGIWWFVTHGPGNRPGNGPVAGPDGPSGPGGYHDAGGPGAKPGSYGTSNYGTAGYGTSNYGTEGYETPGYGQRPPGPVGAATAVLSRPAGRQVDVHSPSHALTRATLGAALIAAAAIMIWARLADPFSVSASLVATAVALGVVALGIVVSGVLGRRSGGLAPIAIVLAIVAANGAAWHGTVAGWNTQRTWAPTSAVEAEQGYDLGAGRAVLDLTQPAVTNGATVATPVNVSVSLGAGRLVVIVPRGVGTEVNGTVGLGNLTDRIGDTGNSSGPGLSRSLSSGGPPVLTVDANVGVGQLEVVPQGTQVQR